MLLRTPWSLGPLNALPPSPDSCGVPSCRWVRSRGPRVRALLARGARSPPPRARPGRRPRAVRRADCWDAEIETCYGWLECARLRRERTDRSTARNPESDRSGEPTSSQSAGIPPREDEEPACVQPRGSQMLDLRVGQPTRSGDALCSSSPQELPGSGLERHAGGGATEVALAPPDPRRFPRRSHEPLQST